MARLARAEIFDPSEIVSVHFIGKTVRSCYLMGFDERSGKNFDHRKRWLEEKLKLLAATFGIDLLAFACMSNHFHLLLRSRPDVVATWDDTQVALRWWQLCPNPIRADVAETLEQSDYTSVQRRVQAIN